MRPVLVIHENRGRNPHIEDNPRAAFATLDQAKTREDFLAAAVPFYGNSPAPAPVRHAALASKPSARLRPPRLAA